MTGLMTARKPKRMLFLLSTLGGGGSERCMVDLLKYLDRTQFAPELYLAYRTGELLSEVPDDVPVHAHVDGPRERTISQKLAGKFRFLSEARALDLIRLARRRPCDLIFAWGLRHAYEAAWVRSATGTPYVAYCVQDPTAELWTDSPFITPWRQRYGRWAYGSARRVYTNSIDLGRRVSELYGLPRSSVDLFSNLRDFSRIERLAKESPIDWPGTGARILTAGRLSTQKGQNILIEAVSRLVQDRRRDISLVIIGQGPLEAELRAQAARLQIADRVHFAGFQANPFPYFQAADLFVLPSLWEGLPNTLIEALALGVPSIAADCPTGPREILEDGRYGTLVPVGDAAALAEAIDRAIADLPAEKSRAASAREAMRLKYDIDQGVRDLERRFLQVLEELKR